MKTQPALFILLLTAAMASAQIPVPGAPAAPAAQPAAEKPERRLNLQCEDTPLEQIVDLYAELESRTVIQSPAVKGKTVTIKGLGLTEEEYKQAIETVLAMNDVALVRMGDRFLKVVPAPSVSQEGISFKSNDADETLADADQIITRIVTLQNIGTDEAQQAIQPLMHTYGKLHILERSNSIMITESALNLKRILEILEHVDQPLGKIEPRIYQLQYATAGDIASKLNELVQMATEQNAPAAAANTAVRTPPGVIRPAKTPAATATAASAADSGMIDGYVKIISDERANLLIVFSKESNFAFFDKIINVLDVPVEPNISAEVIQLEYADAKETASILNDFIGAAVKNKDSNAPATAAASANGDSRSRRIEEFLSRRNQTTTESSNESAAIGRLSEDTKILADERTNSLLLMGQKNDLSVIKQIIRELDTMLAQVMIEAVILEINLNDSMETGINWLKRNITSDEQIVGGWAANKLPFINESGDLIGSTTNSYLSPGNFSYYFNFPSKDLAATINLAKTDGKTDILSTPIIMTTDNTEASITIGDEYPIVTSSGVSSSGNDYSRYEYKNIGIELKVTPRINPGRVVVMEIEQSADQKSDDVIVDDNEVPVIGKREITATVTVPDKATIALGGIVGTTKGKNETKIPFLGDIPLVGNLFKYRSTEETRKELLVLLTPYVLSTPEEARLATERVHQASASHSIEWPTGWSESPLANEGKKSRETTTE